MHALLHKSGIKLVSGAELITRAFSVYRKVSRNFKAEIKIHYLLSVEFLCVKPTLCSSFTTRRSFKQQTTIPRSLCNSCTKSFNGSDSRSIPVFTQLAQPEATWIPKTPSSYSITPLALLCSPTGLTFCDDYGKLSL